MKTENGKFGSGLTRTGQDELPDRLRAGDQLWQ